MTTTPEKQLALEVETKRRFLESLEEFEKDYDKEQVTIAYVRELWSSARLAAITERGDAEAEEVPDEEPEQQEEQQKDTVSISMAGTPIQDTDDDNLVVGSDRWMILMINKTNRQTDNFELNKIYVHAALMNVALEARKLAAIEAQTEIMRRRVENEESFRQEWRTLQGRKSPAED